MKHGLQWGGLKKENQEKVPLPISDYRDLFPKYPWAVITDLNKQNQIKRVSQAMTHPITETFVKYVLDSHIPSPKKRFLLILCCSYKKPYSLSPSHLSLYRPLTYLFVGRDIKDKKCPIDVLAVSGMIGPVPLELEEYSPAPNYDFSLNAISNVAGATDLFHLLAQRISTYLNRVLGFYEKAYSIVSNTYKTVLELALKQMHMQNRKTLKKIQIFPISSLDLPALVEVMIHLRNELHPNYKLPQETKNRHYFESLKKRLKTASKIICESDSRIFC